VAFVALGAIVEPALVLPSIAKTVGARERPGSDAQASLAAHLAGKRILLVVDNFEQVVEAAPELAELLQQCPGLRALVTSRVLLQVRGERAVPVAPLAVPVDASYENVMVSPAGQLFIERAQECNPSFCLNDQSAPAIATICRRLDGLPLALELAAAWADSLSVDAILAGLAQPLAFLTAGPRDLPPHQRTLHDAIAWSYGLLEPAAQRLFARLAVFVGGWDLEAATHVLGAFEGDVARRLSELVRSSVVRAFPSRTGLRYEMLETIREFARQRLGEDPETALIRRRHADYYLALSAGSEWGANFLRDAGWMVRVPPEEANLRGALTWALSGGDREMALRLAAPLAYLCQIGGRHSEGRAVIVLARGHRTTPSATLAEIVAGYRLGEIERVSGNLAAARSIVQEMLEIAQELGDARAVGYCLDLLRRTMRHLGRHEEAHRLQVRALQLFREAGDPSGIARVLASFGVQALVQGDLAAARGYLEESIATARVTHVYCNLGVVALEEGELTEARSHFATYLRRAQAIDNKDAIAQGIEGLACVAAASGQAAGAIRLAAAADALREMIGAPLSPYSREELNRHLRPAVEALSGTDYEVAWSEGQRMRIEDAIAYALGLGTEN